MSNFFSDVAHCERGPCGPCSAIRTLLDPQEKDLGGFRVRRLMPSDELKAVGPYVFFDHLGPVRFEPGTGIDVRPHPHIGLATVTYLFEGEILHRDSLGNVQSIQPAEINWMTAGRGIVHSERTPPALRRSGHDLHALQLWVALPEEHEETEPNFFHYDGDQLPTLETQGVSVRIMIGEAFGVRSPVKTYSPTLYLEARIPKGAEFALPDGVDERAVYVVSGRLKARDTTLNAHQMAVFDATSGVALSAEQDSRLVLIGGKPLGKRTVWWNLVASRRELIEKAKADWKAGRFPQVPEETEFIPLPGD
ncbi:pirin family protein [Geoalkalibacter halelectricus]|uniref:pirin family protein n=1 Tax=Geoalkalibacter halelectricus TaxID=2847045 RepID=UPI003D2299B4